MTSGKRVIFVIGAGLAAIVVFAIILAVYAGAPPVDPEDPTPVARRTDCPSGWRALYDAGSRFSICRPPDWTPTASGDTTIGIAAPAASGAVVVITWLTGSDLQPACPPAAPSSAPGTRSTMKIGGLDRDVCTTDSVAQAGAPAPPASAIAFRQPVTKGGAVEVVGTYRDAAGRALILQVLDTLRVN